MPATTELKPASVPEAPPPAPPARKLRDVAREIMLEKLLMKRSPETVTDKISAALDGLAAVSRKDVGIFLKETIGLDRTGDIIELTYGSSKKLYVDLAGEVERQHRATLGDVLEFVELTRRAKWARHAYAMWRVSDIGRRWEYPVPGVHPSKSVLDEMWSSVQTECGGMITITYDVVKAYIGWKRSRHFPCYVDPRCRPSDVQTLRTFAAYFQWWQNRLKQGASLASAELLAASARAVENNHRRFTLVRALCELAVLLDQIGSEDSRTNDITVSRLVQVEQLLRELRYDHIPSAVSSNMFDSEQALLLQQSLESAASSSWNVDGSLTCWSRVLLGLSRAGSLTLQLSEERGAIGDLEETFDTTFLTDQGGPRSDCAPRFIKTVVKALEQRILLENQWHLEEMEGLVAERQERSIDAWQSASPVLISRTRLGARSLRGYVCNNVIGESTLEDSVIKFLQAPVHDLAPVTALLVVGDNGSGKTHLCEKIEQDAKAARCVGKLTH
jgi:hypothetical protein